MEKIILDTRVVSNDRLSQSYALLKVTPADGSRLPEMKPGQFVEIAIPGGDVLLRRPISINYVDVENNVLWLLVRKAGRGTARLVELEDNSILNLVLPLGNGFSVPDDADARVLLVGGGVGVAPLLYLGKALKDKGLNPCFLLGARTAADILEYDDFKQVGEVYISTEDGSEGEKGLVTFNSALKKDYDTIYCCGPAPMMKAVAAIASQRGINCEVSLENMMACGVGACLCCVEKTVKGNVCVCTEGPVFNIKELTW